MWDAIWLAGAVFIALVLAFAWVTKYLTQPTSAPDGGVACVYLGHEVGLRGEVAGQITQSLALGIITETEAAAINCPAVDSSDSPRTRALRAW